MKGVRDVDLSLGKDGFHYFTWYRDVNIAGNTKKGVAITNVRPDLLDWIFEFLSKMHSQGIPLRIEKKFIGVYSDIFNQKGWYINPRDWDWRNPLKICWYAEIIFCEPDSDDDSDDD
jgi:hypothetical protein